MNENELIKGIQEILSSEYIGDDCAYLKDLGIVVTQDSLVENIHFDRKLITPLQLGYKSIMVNLSDIAASGAEPAYLTISLSLPKNIAEDYVTEFYKGAKEALKGTNAQIVGGDITGSDKLYVSVCAIGKTNNRCISSRKNAKIGQKIIVSGAHGSSGAGLRELLEGKCDGKFITKHLMPRAQLEFSAQIALTEKNAYAMMDTSDGLLDCLSQIAFSSGVMLEVDFEKIPYDKELEKFENYKDLILFGGEDYELVATVDNPQNFTVIGEVKAGSGVKIIFRDKSQLYSKEDVEKNLYNHFKEQ